MCFKLPEQRCFYVMEVSKFSLTWWSIKVQRSKFVQVDSYLRRVEWGNGKGRTLQECLDID